MLALDMSCLVLLRRIREESATSRWAALGACSVLALAGLGACASVPKESVELSYQIGQDLQEVHRAYKVLVQQHFELLRQQVNEKIDEVYIPAFLFGTTEPGGERGYIASGTLEDFVRDHDALGVADWAEIAVKRIDERRQEELKPFYEKEEELLADIDDAFGRLIRANATITAHLNSLREVQEVQNEVLKALKLKDLRDKINDALVATSTEAGEAVKRLDETRKLVKDPASVLGGHGN